LIPTGERFGLHAHRKDGKRSVENAEEKLTVFLELEISNQRLRLIRRKMTKEKTNENNN
jgi:hypothetical protein